MTEIGSSDKKEFFDPNLPQNTSMANYFVVSRGSGKESAMSESGSILIGQQTIATQSQSQSGNDSLPIAA